MGNGPDGAGPSDGGDSATRRSRLHRQERKTRSLGRDVQGSGQVSTAILRPALLLEKENSGDGSGDFGLRFGDGKRPRRSWALRKEGNRMGDREPWAGRPRRRAGLHGDSPTRAPFGEGECGGLFAVCCLLFGDGQRPRRSWALRKKGKRGRRVMVLGFERWSLSNGQPEGFVGD